MRQSCLKGQAFGLVVLGKKMRQSCLEAQGFGLVVLASGLVVLRQSWFEVFYIPMDLKNCVSLV